MSLCLCSGNVLHINDGRVLQMREHDGSLGRMALEKQCVLRVRGMPLSRASLENILGDVVEANYICHFEPSYDRWAICS